MIVVTYENYKGGINNLIVVFDLRLGSKHAWVRGSGCFPSSSRKRQHGNGLYPSFVTITV